MAKGARSITKKKRGKKVSGTPRSRAVGILPLAARRHPLVAEVERQLARCGSPFANGERGAPLVLGVSGGADSVALLLATVAIRDRKNERALIPIVGHVHHHLRKSADDDAAFVGELCTKFGVECHVIHVNPGEMRGNVSANARMLRYEALAQLARQVGAMHVAVAHHGEDQLETMLIALCRGAGLDGMTGMAWTRPLWCGVSLVRPLLGVLKSDCEDLCRAAVVSWREDPTNTDPQRVRARLRRDVLPHLRELWPDAARRSTAAAEVMRAAKASLDQQLEQVFGPAEQREWKRESLQALPGAVIAAGLRRAALDAASHAGDELNQRHLLLAAECVRSSEKKPRQFDWPRRLRLMITSKQVALTAR
jgi:tRNA(Ile)-lysidine synthase